MLFRSPNVVFQSFQSAASVALTSAIYPGVRPTAVALMLNGVSVTGTTTFAWNGTNWVATFPANATQFLYKYGQDVDQVGGKVVRIQSLVDAKTREDLFKFVEIARTDYLNYPPPFTQIQGVVSRTQESANVVTAGYIYRVQNAPISINHQVIVEVQGNITDPTTGITTVVSGSQWFTLPTAPNQAITAGLSGAYHNVNWRTGVIELAGNIVATAVRATYSSIADKRAGAVTWGRGIEGLTDGRYLTAPATVGATAMVPTSRAGIPAYLNFADVVGEMRLLVN